MYCCIYYVWIDIYIYIYVLAVYIYIYIYIHIYIYIYIYIRRGSVAKASNCPRIAPKCQKQTNNNNDNKY